jgi:CheY-like chemotaxis protein
MPLKILVVEDEILIGKSITKKLQLMGHEVAWTAHGLDALKMIENQHFDRIICDLMLQDISGFDIINDSLKTIPSERIKTLFVLMTAYSSTQVLEKAKSYGCKLFKKPFDNLEAALLEMIQ